MKVVREWEWYNYGLTIVTWQSLQLRNCYNSDSPHCMNILLSAVALYDKCYVSFHRVESNTITRNVVLKQWRFNSTCVHHMSSRWEGNEQVCVVLSDSLLCVSVWWIISELTADQVTKWQVCWLAEWFSFSFTVWLKNNKINIIKRNDYWSFWLLMFM